MNGQWDPDYQRVLPRDAFNEGSLSNCIGRLGIALSEEAGTHGARLSEGPFGCFGIAQDIGSGDITMLNVMLHVGDARYRLVRPLNSRSKWPLWIHGEAEDSDFDPIRAFDEDGVLSVEMMELIRARHEA